MISKMICRISRNMIWQVILCVLSVGFAGKALADGESSLSSWVRREKIRMGWGPALEQYRAMAKSGMNAVMPRLELDAVVDYNSADAERPLSKRDANVIREIRAGARKAKILGLKYFYCLDIAAEYQTVAVGFKNNPARFNDGKLPSLVDKIYWKRAILQRVHRVLDLLDDDNIYALDGVIIDPEMYTLSAAVPHGADYGKYAFETFLKEISKPIPENVKGVKIRKRWLMKNNLNEQFLKWQFERIASMARELRELVHFRRPDAILGFIIYKNELWFNAIAKGLATKKIPVFIGPESTYSGVMDNSFIRYVNSIRENVAVPCFIVPGVRMGIENNVIPRKLLRVLEGNIYRRCLYTDGYWVWAIYRFGNEQQQSIFFETLSRINCALDVLARTGKIDNKLKAMPLPIMIPGEFASLLKQAKYLKPIHLEIPYSKADFKVPHLRDPHILVLWPDSDKRTSVKIRVVKLGNYLDVGNIQIFDEQGRLIWQDSIPPNTSKIFCIPQTSSKIYFIVISAGMNAYRIENISCPALLINSKGISVNARGFAGRFFFFVPQNRKTFSIKLSGHPIETASYILYDSQGHIVKQWKKLTQSKIFSVKVTCPGIWRLDIDDVVDDAGFKLIDLPNIFAFRAKDIRIANKE